MDVHEYDIVLEIETFWQLSGNTSDSLDSIDELPAPIDYAAEANNDVKNKENDRMHSCMELGIEFMNILQRLTIRLGSGGPFSFQQ